MSSVSLYVETPFPRETSSCFSYSTEHNQRHYEICPGTYHVWGTARHHTAGSCPKSAHNGVVDQLNGDNGQACYWFNNGCTVGCDACDGTTSHVGHGYQEWLYKGMTQAEVIKKNVSFHFRRRSSPSLPETYSTVTASGLVRCS